MNLFGDLLRGHTDMLLLSIINKKDSYGYLVNKEIEEMTDNEFSFTEATLYTRFKYLVDEGYLATYWIESDNNKKRKYYSITQRGKDYLKTKLADWEKTKNIIEKIIE